MRHLARAPAGTSVGGFGHLGGYGWAGATALRALDAWRATGAAPLPADVLGSPAPTGARQ